MTRQVVLVTGGFGFLGRAVARKFKQQGWRVVGIGRGRWAPQDALAHGFDIWLEAGVSLPALMALQDRFELVVHCAGNGSVSQSLSHPLQDFTDTVQGSADLLEYLRLTESTALLVYPSSAGVYGAREDAPIRETDALTPVSPYGWHKKIVEDLLASHAQSHGRRVAIIRFFSIYGPGLAKQLLWDAGARLRAANDGVADFWGTGEETRDWIASVDAADLVFAVSRSAQQQFTLLNGASGRRVTVRETIELLRDALGSNAQIAFNQVVRKGDPRFYHADVSRAMALGWAPSTPLAEGIRNYAGWLAARKERSVD